MKELIFEGLGVMYCLSVVVMVAVTVAMAVDVYGVVMVRTDSVN